MCERERERQTDRQTEQEREREREKEGGVESKVILKKGPSLPSTLFTTAATVDTAAGDGQEDDAPNSAHTDDHCLKVHLNFDRK